MQNSIKNITKKPYAIFLSILMVLVIAIWIYLWSGLASFEAGIPQNLLNTMLEEIEEAAAKDGDCQKLLAKYAYTPGVGSIQSDGVALAQLVAEKDLSYKKKTAWEGAGAEAYSILADGEEIAVVTLSAKKREGIMGLALYEVSGLLGPKNLTILADPDATVHVGSLELNKTTPNRTSVIPKELEKLSAYAANIIEVPIYSEYIIQGLFSVPKITATFMDGKEVPATFIEEDYVIISEPASDALIEEVTERVTTITQKYSYYMSDDLDWNGFKGYLINTAPIYDRLRTLEVYWYTLHDSTRFENMEVENFFVFSDNLISVRLTYDYVVVGQGKVTTYKTDLSYYLATDVDGMWRVAEMSVN